MNQSSAVQSESCNLHLRVFSKRAENEEKTIKLQEKSISRWRSCLVVPLSRLLAGVGLAPSPLQFRCAPPFRWAQDKRRLRSGFSPAHSPLGRAEFNPSTNLTSIAAEPRVEVGWGEAKKIYHQSSMTLSVVGISVRCCSALSAGTLAHVAVCHYQQLSTSASRTPLGRFTFPTPLHSEPLTTCP